VTIRETLRFAAERLETHRVPSARLTAELLLSHALSASREYLYAHDDRTLSEEELQRLEDLVDDRMGGVPLQYIVGRQEFYGRYFHVNPAVLIPRPETEYIVEAVLEKTETREQTPRLLSMADIGTGSGCIAITLALEIPAARVFATDISEEALRVARQNAADLKANVDFVCMDVMDALQSKFDLIVSNPPYVRPTEITNLEREVREHEPHIALFSPDDEVAIYRRLVTGAEQMLISGGCLIMEIGLGMEEKVLGLFGEDWEKLPTKTDLQGIPRTVIAKRMPLC
jgi:release factor glutamine methyltransferase